MLKPGGSIAVVGRLDRLPRRRVVAGLRKLHVTLKRELAGDRQALVITHGAVALIAGGKLQALLEKADRLGVPTLSENALLRLIGLLPPPPPEARTHPLEEVAARAGLDVGATRVLALFDIIEDREGLYGFRDIKVARDVSRRLPAMDLSTAVATALEARRLDSFRRHLSGISIREDDRQADLPLDAPDESFDDLWDEAVEAEDLNDYESAAEAYRKCLAIRPRDPQCLVKYADALTKLERRQEGLGLLRKAVALDQGLADAWFKIALLESGSKGFQALRRAVLADPSHVEATYLLAFSYVQAKAYREAQPLLARYLSLAEKKPAPAEAKKKLLWAKRALTLCRMAQLRDRAGKA